MDHNHEPLAIETLQDFGLAMIYVSSGSVVQDYLHPNKS